MRTMHTGPILIADITGYSQYLNESELVHAEQTLSALLELLVERTRPPLVVDEEITTLDPSAFKEMIGAVIGVFPNLEIVATTLRNAKSAGFNDWGAILHAGGVFHESRLRPDLEIHDRVGGGDGFASGMIWALLDGKPVQEAVELGAAHGALTMTTPGDTSMVTAADVLRAVTAQGARVVR